MNNKAQPPNKSRTVSDNDLDLFHQAINGPQGKTLRIKQDKIHPTKATSKQKNQQKTSDNKAREASFYFSDEFVPELPTEGPMIWVQEGQDTYLAKQLRRGDFYPDLILDLHGLTKAHAKLEVAGLIDECRRKHIRCACIVHGKGEYILKQKVPHYLVQHPAVLAFHEAPKQWGGKSALLLLIDVPDR